MLAESADLLQTRRESVAVLGIVVHLRRYRLACEARVRNVAEGPPDRLRRAALQVAAMTRPDMCSFCGA